MKKYLTLIRAHNWLKNSFVFAPILFVGELFDWASLQQVILVFIAYSATASFVYILNDIVDADNDRQHPKKKNRPIASGAISKSSALILGVILLTVGLGIGFSITTAVGNILLAYIILNVLYSAKLKHVVILDVMVIAIGFVLRIVAGAVAISTVLSPWIIMCGFFVTLFLAISKRRQELLLIQHPKTLSEKTRAVLDDYSIDLLDKMILVVISATLLSYFLYTFNADLNNDWMILTTPFVIYGMFRYLYVLDHNDEDDPIALLIKDRAMLLNTGLWVTSVILILYL